MSKPEKSMQNQQPPQSSTAVGKKHLVVHVGNDGVRYQGLRDNGGYAAYLQSVSEAPRPKLEPVGATS